MNFRFLSFCDIILLLLGVVSLILLILSLVNGIKKKWNGWLAFFIGLFSIAFIVYASLKIYNKLKPNKKTNAKNIYQQIVEENIPLLLEEKDLTKRTQDIFNTARAYYQSNGFKQDDLYKRLNRAVSLPTDLQTEELKDLQANLRQLYDQSYNKLLNFRFMRK